MAVVERKTIGERTFNGVNIFLLTLLSVIFLYPMWHCLMASFSDPVRLTGYRGFIFAPLGHSMEGYTAILRNRNIGTGYTNTIIYILVGTSINMLLTILGGYALSRKRLMLRRVLTLAFVFTMYVDFGLIPAFLNVKGLGLYNTRWALLLPGAISTYNLIVMRTAFQAIPASLEESAYIDGADDFVILFRIMLPLAKATLAVIVLFYAVGHWNAWFSAAIYLQNRDFFPLQLFLREILLANSSNAMMDLGSLDSVRYLDELLKYCSIIVATVPILCVYPFIQKYFVTGVMLGSVKE